VIDKKYLDKTMDNLARVFGVRAPLYAGHFYEQASSSTKEANVVILEHLGIRNPVGLDFVVNVDSSIRGTPELADFHPGRIILPEAVKVKYTTHGSMHEVGRIRMPTLVKIEVNAKYRNDIRAMGAILAHEDTHLILWLSEYPRGDTIWHEIETDIACIVFGLGDLVINGRDRYRGGGRMESMGYLDDESFLYVQNRISKIQSILNNKKEEKKMPGVKCSKCGYDKNPVGDRFCSDCGAELKEEAQVLPAGPVAPTAPPVQKQGATAPVASSSGKTVVPKAKLVVKRNGRVGTEFPIDQESVSIGRWDADSGSFAEIDLSKDDADKYVSRKHARIFLKDGQYFIEDSGSVNGTYVNKGPRLVPGNPQKLQNNDEVIIARTIFQFVIE
jgi:predicted Zn-ribbon and HTH transcriptional regulator